jgi:TorA maturation chaperone TorD
VDSALHQKLIDQVDELSKNFHVLILKTNMTIPYTSVFLQLDCKYWGADSEQRLRNQMKGK